jgi:hypothetical protein
MPCVSQGGGFPNSTPKKPYFSFIQIELVCHSLEAFPSNIDVQNFPFSYFYRSTMAKSYREITGAPLSTASPSDSTLIIIDAQNEYVYC